MNRATSLYLDLIRPIAALVVILCHVGADNLSGGRLSFMDTAGVQAVDVFFVLSGFVIAYVTSSRERTLRDYAVSRAARIYSVAIPAIILTVIADHAGIRHSPSTYEGAYQPLSPGLLIRSVFFIGEQWNAHRFPGSDGPYWSLGFEVWYYAAFGAFVFTPGRWKWLAAGLVLAFIGNKVVAMFPVWLLGVALFHIAERRHFSQRAGWAMLVLPIFLFAGFEAVRPQQIAAFEHIDFSFDRLQSIAQDWLVGLLFAVHLLGFITVSPCFAGILDRYAKPIRWLAGATFSLYLAHLPIMHLIAAWSPWPKGSNADLILLLTASPLACLVFAEVSERRKTLWRKLFAGLYGLGGAVLGRASIASRRAIATRDS